MKIIKYMRFLLSLLSFPLFLLWGVGYGISEYLETITLYWACEIKREK